MLDLTSTLSFRCGHLSQLGSLAHIVILVIVPLDLVIFSPTNKSLPSLQFTSSLLILRLSDMFLDQSWVLFYLFIS
jgi:hypothetical protein